MLSRNSHTASDFSCVSYTQPAAQSASPSCTRCPRPSSFPQRQLRKNRTPGTLSLPPSNSSSNAARRTRANRRTSGSGKFRGRPPRAAPNRPLGRIEAQPWRCTGGLRSRVTSRLRSFAARGTIDAAAEFSRRRCARAAAGVNFDAPRNRRSIYSRRSEDGRARVRGGPRGLGLAGPSIRSPAVPRIIRFTIGAMQL